MPITQVQTPKRGAAGNSSTLTVTLNSAPASGNVLVAVIGTFASFPPSVNSIAQASGSVTWTRQNYSSDASLYGRRVEIWTGIVSGTASASLTITLSASANPVIANVAEYSGLNTSSLLDTSASSIGSYTTTLTTGTTPTTSQADELWLGGIINVINPASGAGITSPTNSFTLYDGTGFVDGLTVALAYLDRIVSATGAAYTGATGASGATYSAYAGCIVTLKGGTGGGGTDLVVAGNLTVNGNATFDARILADAAQYPQTNAQLKAHLYKINGGTPDEYDWNTMQQYIRFGNSSDAKACLFCMRLTDGGNEPVLYWNRALAIRKDIVSGGRLDTQEGVLSMLGGVGWGPNGYNSNPFIWLVGNHYDAPAKDTLEIRISNTSGWLWGKLACGNLTCNGTIQVNNGENILPASANAGNIGTNVLYWGSVWANYVRYKTLLSFDALDDLALAKSYKTLTITEEGVEHEVVDPDSLAFLKADSKEPFFDNGKTTGFLLGCVKALVQRVEALEQQLKKK
jgi:hypothetical protein